MVFGWLAALALDSASHIAGESTIKHGEKEFDRFIMSYEFAMEGQKLKREDVRDLLELVLGRMEMYHLVGALLLQFCVAFYGEFKLLEEEYASEPSFILEIFLLSNITAIGYLLFAVWLSLHASVAAHAIGIEFLLNASRLTVPSPENLRYMRQATSVFRHVHDLFEEAERRQGMPPGLQPGRPLGSPRSRGRAIVPRKFVTESDFDDPLPLAESDGRGIKGQGDELAPGAGKLPLSLARDADTMEHRHRFAGSHKGWLGFDAYSRVCMALGINQMLQALSYFIVGPVQQKRPSSALISLFSVQAVALLLLKLDLRNTDGEDREKEKETDPQDSDCSDASSASRASFLAVGSRDVSVASWRDLVLVLSTYSLAPLWATLALWAHRFSQHRTSLSFSVTPCFFLHGVWLMLVLRIISPSEGEMLPQRLRSVGYLDIFTKDIQPEETTRGSKESFSSAMGPKGVRTLKQGVGGGAPVTFHESAPWLVVRRFTLTIILMWMIAGCVHVGHILYPSFEEFKAGQDQNIEETGEARRLRAVWPEPASFFEVTALHCNSSHVTFSGPDALFSTRRMDDAAALGPLAESGGPHAHSVMCRDEGCEALVPRGGTPGSGGTAWRLEPTGSAYFSGAPGQAVPLPQEWRLVTGAWLPRQGDAEVALLAGWDGTTITVAEMRRESIRAPWSLRRRFVVRPSSGRRASCGAAPTDSAGAGSECAPDAAEPRREYAGVRAIQLSANGACETLSVLLPNGTLDGWDISGGTKIGSWRVSSAEHTAMCHHGRDLLLTHPGGRGGPVLEVVPLPQALATCPAARRAGPTE